MIDETNINIREDWKKNVLYKWCKKLEYRENHYVETKGDASKNKAHTISLDLAVFELLSYT